jgi:hypothetical protein
MTFDGGHRTALCCQLAGCRNGRNEQTAHLLMLLDNNGPEKRIAPRALPG